MDTDYARTLNVGGLSRSHESQDLLSGDRTVARREQYKACSHLNISDSDLGQKTSPLDLSTYSNIKVTMSYIFF